jgi:SAM-dependent methyltransferase
MLLDGIPDESVDVVTTRSVLIYVAGKKLAFDAFYRVLKPGGTFSLFEPLNGFAQPEPDHLLWGYNVTPIQGVAAKVKAHYLALQPPERDPMLNFDATDLVNWAQSAGFREVHLELYADITPISEYDLTQDWQTFLHTPPNPRVPSLHDAMEEALTLDEQTALESHLCPLVEAGDGIHQQAVAYVWGEK